MTKSERRADPHGHRGRPESTGISAAERAERAEMFSFHPDILNEAAPAPRRVGGARQLHQADRSTTTSPEPNPATVADKHPVGDR